MTTLPGPKTEKADPNSLEKKVYNIVEKFSNNIPLPNDRYRLGYTLFKYMSGEGDPPEILVNSTKIKIEGVTKAELAASLNEELGKI
jgi:hypothetical protein